MFRFTASVERKVLPEMQVMESMPEMEECPIEPMDTSEMQYNWFYLAECGQWHMFEMEEDISFRDKEADPTGICCINSEEIEKRYLKNPRDSFTFFTPKFCYKIDFAEMKQTNLITGKQRPVKRAPSSSTAVRYICDNRSIPLPQHWEQVDSDKPYQLIQVSSITNEYSEVASNFGRTMAPSRISCIHRIQNLALWEFYCRKKAQLMKVRGVSDIREEMLFHGTSFEFVDAICCSNFDWRLNGTHGVAYGKGTYFAKDAVYSSRYCKENKTYGTFFKVPGFYEPRDRSCKVMFLARVLVGNYTVGHSSYNRPPSVDGSTLNLYDSCVDNCFNPLIYVVFDCNHIYPEYLIEWS